MDNIETEFAEMNISSSGSSSLYGSMSLSSTADNNSRNKEDSTCVSERYKYTESCKKKLDEVLDYFKDFYTFLLLDKSKIENAIENIDDFAKAVFYVGVRQLSSGMNIPINQTKEFKAKIKETTKEILKVSRNISKEEAFKCQACLIETIDTKCLNNYYPKDSIWKKEIKMIPEERKEVGLALLEEVRIVYKRVGPNSFENQYSLENIDEDDHLKNLYYTYLLLDPRKLTKALETIDDFADAIFYVGKGSGRRVFNHGSETRRFLENPKSWTKNITAKHQKIMEIWRDVGRILKLKVSQYISLGEAKTREAFFIETISLDKLANNRMGTYKYYPKASKDQKKRMSKNARREVGTALLQEAMTIFEEKRRRCAPMSMYYSRKRKFDSLQSVKLVHNESCKAKFQEFSNILNKELKRFNHYPKNTEEYFVFICIMLDRQKPTPTCVAAFVDALIYVSLEKEDQSQTCKQRYTKAYQMYNEKGVASNDIKQINRLYKFWMNEESHVHHWQCPTKLRFAQGLYFEGLLACILGKEKTNNLVINVHEMMTDKDLGKASIGLLERIRILYVKTDAQPTPPETPVRSTPPTLHPAHLFELPAPLATPPIEPLPTHLPISP